MKHCNTKIGDDCFACIEKDCKLNLIFFHYGAKAQVKKTIEELKELIVELEKYGTDQQDDKRIISEIADVRNTTTQIANFFGPEYVENEEVFKIDRQLRRIKESG